MFKPERALSEKEMGGPRLSICGTAAFFSVPEKLLKIREFPSLEILGPPMVEIYFP